jgi:beta-lactamase regulating signal transducer with metallopeptidase domain
MPPSPIDVRTWEAIGWTMIHFLWVGSLIGLLALMLRLILRRASANMRYVCLLGCLAALSAAPPFIAWRLSREREPAVLLPALTRAAAVEVMPSEGDPASQEAAESPGSPSRELIDAAGAAARAPAGRWLPGLVRSLPWLWLLGAPLALVSLVLGLWGSERLCRRSSALGDARVLELFEALQRSLRIARRVTLAACDRIVSPLVVGILRPVILLPPAVLAGWSPQQVEMVLLHELAHVRRWDNLVNLLQRIVESLLFFHPAVWWLSRQVRLERECACDDVVLARGGDRRLYAETLASLALAAPVRLAWNGATALSENETVHRIHRLLAPSGRSMRLSWAWTAFLLGLLCLPLACALLQGPAPEAAGESPFRFLRFRETAEAEGHLETARALYTGPSGAEVLLIAGFPFAERDHYRRLQELFSTCDIVLHESSGRAGVTEAAENGVRRGMAERLFDFVRRGEDLIFRSLFELESEDAVLDLSGDRFARPRRETKAARTEPAEPAPRDLVDDLKLLIEAARHDANLYLRYLRKRWEGGGGGFAAGSFKALAARELVLLWDLAWPPAGPLEAERPPPEGDAETSQEARDRALVEGIAELIEAGRSRIGLYFYPGRLSEIEARLARDGRFRMVSKQWLAAWEASREER